MKTTKKLSKAPPSVLQSLNTLQSSVVLHLSYFRNPPRVDGVEAVERTFKCTSNFRKVFMPQHLQRLWALN